MLMQSADIIREKHGGISRINVYGQEKEAATYRLTKMNLALLGISHHLGGESDSTFTHDLHKGLYFHCIMANPPSNLKGEYDENLKNDSCWVDYDLIMGLFAFYGFTPSFNDSHENICGIYSIALFKKTNNKRKRQSNAGNPTAKQKRGPCEPRQGAGPDFGLSIHEGGPSSWTTSFQWDSDRDCRAEDTVLSSPFPPGLPGQPLRGESAYCPSQQCLRA